MKTKKILYVHANNDDIGGSDYCLFKMVKEIKERNYEPSVLLCKSSPIIHLYDKHQLKVFIKPIKSIQKSRNPLTLICYIYHIPKNIYYIYKIIKREQIEIIHSNDLLDFAGSIAGKLAKIKCIQHVRMIIPNIILRKILSFIVLNLNDFVLAVSQSVADCITKKKNHMKVLYDWIDMDLVGHNETSSNISEELNLSTSDPIILSIGRLEYWKGQHIFIAAALQILKKYKNCKFLVVGGTVKGKQSYLNLLKKKIPMEYASSFYFLGERKDISSLMHQCTFMVHSSVLPDPFPGVVLEALNNNTVVIGTRMGGVPEQISENRTGLLYKAGDVQELADKMVHLLNNPDLLNKMKECTKKEINSRFNKYELLNELVNYYSN